jgi:6-phosphofructokinase 1
MLKAPKFKNRDGIEHMDNLKRIEIAKLGEASITSPISRRRFYNGEGVIRQTDIKTLQMLEEGAELEFFELAGPRKRIYFNPAETTIGIVTCGGLCPGLNDVIRAITFCAIDGYGVKKVLGFQYGYEGLVAKYYESPIDLNTTNTDDIHEKGGTILKSSRGRQDIGEMVNTLIHYGINILFTIGGDGTLTGASLIAKEIERRNLKISVIGIPKTIDNDISQVDRSFGFQTAVEAACPVIMEAHTEAQSYRNGVGLVKLMGRHSGAIASMASLSNSAVNFCLIPEVDFELEGPNGFLKHLKERLKRKSHVVIVVAEGAGQTLLKQSAETDKSGNLRLADIGTFLRDQINASFKADGLEVNVKYFDPSYSIRSRPANAADSAYCLMLGNNAVHAAMAGKTDMILGLHKDSLIHLPISMIGRGKKIDPDGWQWQAVLQSTHQPAEMTN